MSMSEVSAGAPDGMEDPEEYEEMQVVKPYVGLADYTLHMCNVCIILFYSRIVHLPCGFRWPCR